MFNAAIITASDKGAAGQREDVSGAVIRELLEAAGYRVVSSQILPDERGQLSAAMREICDKGMAALVITTGGTGFSPRDCTPEATLDIGERLAPGIAEGMRYASLQITPRAMLSRGVAVIRGGTLVVNLPGSPKAVRENLTYLLPVLGHGLEILTGQARECAQPMGNP